MKSIDRLVEIIKRLRAPDGCPWDREQTHASIRGHLVEECAELLEAIDKRDDASMREELGDVLMHIMLHAEMADEQGAFKFDDVARELGDKLIRRHPHVFGDKSAADSSDVLKIWQDVKKSEKKARAVGGLFDGIAPQLSAMRFALEIAKKADAQTLENARANALRDEAELEAELKRASEPPAGTPAESSPGNVPENTPKNAAKGDSKAAQETLPKAAQNPLLKAASPEAASKAARKLAAARFGRLMFDLILEAAKNKVEPEGALRDYIGQIRKICR